LIASTFFIDFLFVSLFSKTLSFYAAASHLKWFEVEIIFLPQAASMALSKVHLLLELLILVV